MSAPWNLTVRIDAGCTRKVGRESQKGWGQYDFKRRSGRLKVGRKFQFQSMRNPFLRRWNSPGATTTNEMDLRHLAARFEAAIHRPQHLQIPLRSQERRQDNPTRHFASPSKANMCPVAFSDRH